MPSEAERSYDSGRPADPSAPPEADAARDDDLERGAILGTPEGVLHPPQTSIYSVYGDDLAMNANSSSQSVAVGREQLVARGRRLEYLTIGWNATEAAVAIVAGVIAGSIALVGFGLDSVIETSSAGILLWRFAADHDSERAERTAQRLVGICFLLLAAYVAVESISGLWSKERPERSIPGIILAIVSLISMPWLARAKRRVAAQLGSAALHSDSRQADFCAWLSAILLAGLLLNWLLGWWWTDPAAALVMVPIIAREGVQGLRGEGCGCD